MNKGWNGVYSDIVRSLFARVRVLHSSQAVQYMSRYLAGVSEETAWEILLSCARSHMIVITRDGYVMSRATWLTLSHWKADVLSQKSSYAYLPDVLPEIDSDLKDVMDCFCIVLDMMPDSRNFVAGNHPWIFQFVHARTSGDDELVQIARFRKGSEVATATLITSNDGIDDPRWRDAVHRIALLDDPDMEYLIPHCGFREILEYTAEEPHFRILKVRKDEEVWG